MKFFIVPCFFSVLALPLAFSGSPHAPLAAAAPAISTEHGAEVYTASCSICHGADRTGMPPTFPSLVGVTKRFSDADITKQIRNGKGRMLAFPDMSDNDINSLLLFLKTDPPAK